MVTSWHAYPIVRLTLPLAVGIWLGTYLSFTPSFVFLIIGYFVLLLVGTLKGRSLPVRQWGWLLSILMICIGWYYLKLADPLSARDHWQTVIKERGVERWHGEIRRVKSSASGLRLEAAIHHIEDQNGHHHHVSGPILIYLPKEAPDVNPIPGSTIQFSGYPVTIPAALELHGFDWRQYMRLKGITHQVYLKAGHFQIEAPKTFALRPMFFRWQQEMRRILKGYIKNDQAFQLVSAMTLGDRDEFSPILNEAYQASGAVHVLAVSGLHTGIVAFILLTILSVILKGQRFLGLRSILAIAGVWMFIGITGAADSAVRAGVLFSVLLFGKSINRTAQSLNLLATAVLILLLWNPAVLHHLGFQLSVMAVGGILFFQPIFYRIWDPGFRLGRYIWSLVSVTLAAQLGTLMISLYHFHQFPVYFLLSGILLVPLAGILLSGGLAILSLHFLWPFLADKMAVWVQHLANLMNAIVTQIAGMPGSLWKMLYPDGYWAWLFPIVVGMLVFGLYQRHQRAVVLSMTMFTLGTLAWLGFQIQTATTRSWQILALEKGKPLLVIRQGFNTAAVQLTDSLVEAHYTPLPGWPKSVWLLPRDAKAKHGKVLIRDNIAIAGNDTISWGSNPYGQYYICTDPKKFVNSTAENAIFFLLPGISGRQKPDILRKVASGQKVVNLRDYGYWEKKW